MIDLPKGFPMYCKDLKQIIDEKNIDKSLLPKQINEHDALSDAKWNMDVFNFIK